MEKKMKAILGFRASGSKKNTEITNFLCISWAQYRDQFLESPLAETLNSGLIRWPLIGKEGMERKLRTTR